MSTTRDFEDAPVGATATGPDGKRAVKTFNTTSPWRTELNEWPIYTRNSVSMAAAGFTLAPAPGTDLTEADLQLQNLTLWTVPGLVEAIAHGRVHIAPGHDPALTAPTTAQEALDLAWELAHEVKKGQTIPKGTKYLERHNGALREYTAFHDMNPKAGGEEWLRTLDPLPDTEPDWLDAPAVVALVKGRVGDPQVFARENKTGTQWVRDTKVYHWDELIDVVPLYPKETNND